MASFRSNQELFQAVKDLTIRLDGRGHAEAADELKRGFGAVNGLTDGWALFLESIDKVQRRHRTQFEPDEQKALSAIRAAVHKSINRR